MFDMKKQLMWSKLKVGLVITLALITLFLTVFFAGSVENILAPKVNLKAHLQDVKGLRKGAPVWISGIEVGSVKEIALSPDYGTMLTISIKKQALGFIKKDSQASVLTMGLLGDKYVELTSGSPNAEPIKPGDVIKGAAQIELKEVMEIGTASVQKMSDFISKLENLVTKIEKGEGTVSKFITDPSLYNNLKNASNTLSFTLKEIKDARGTMKLLIEDPTLYNKLLAASASMEGFSKTISESSGTFKKMIEDPSLYNKVLTAASSIEDFSRKLNEKPGTLNKLVEDAELYENLNKASLQLSTILERIDQGEGLAGTLLKDKELPNELKNNLLELKALLKDMREHPTKYFKFSLF